MKKITGLFLLIIISLSVISAGASETTAEPSVMWGDANGDGRVTVGDATCVQRHVAEIEKIPEENLKAAHVGGNGMLTVKDATLIQQYVAEMIDHFPAEEHSDEIKMTINSTPVKVDWENNEAVAALKEAVKSKPLSVQMSMYGGFEQVGSLGMSLPRNDTRITTSPGDVILYSGNQMVVFYGSNTWAYTRLGHISDKTNEELTRLLSNGNVTITLTY